MERVVGLEPTRSFRILTGFADQRLTNLATPSKQVLLLIFLTVKELAEDTGLEPVKP